MRAEARELKTLIPKPANQASALALMHVLMECQLRLPSGSTLNGEKDEAIGREEAAEIVSYCAGIPDPVSLKVAFNMQTEDIGEFRDNWKQTLRSVGVVLDDW